AVDGHLQVGARKAIAVNVARHGGRSSQGFVDLLPVDLLGARGGGERHRGGEHEGLAETHDFHPSSRGQCPVVAPTPKRKNTMPAAQQAARVGIIPTLKRRIASTAAAESANAHGSMLASRGASKLNGNQRTGNVSWNTV